MQIKLLQRNKKNIFFLYIKIAELIKKEILNHILIFYLNLFIQIVFIHRKIIVFVFLGNCNKFEFFWFLRAAFLPNKASVCVKHCNTMKLLKLIKLNLSFDSPEQIVSASIKKSFGPRF